MAPSPECPSRASILERYLLLWLILCPRMNDLFAIDYDRPEIAGQLIAGVDSKSHDE